MDTRSFFELNLTKRRISAAAALGKTEGVHMHGSYQGTVRIGEDSADIHIEPDGSLMLDRETAAHGSSRWALERSHLLPGNLRFVRSESMVALRAETQLDGELHLGRTFAQLMEGMRRSGRDEASPVETAIARETLDAAVGELAWPEDALVRLEQGWELRPRLEGTLYPLQLAVHGDGVQLERALLVLPEDEASVDAVCDQALRFNGRLRLARLAVRGEQLLAETRLHAGQLSPSWLETAALAVAAAARHTAETLSLLAAEPELATWYGRMLKH